MNHKIISKITSGALLCTMVAYTAPVLAYTKDETVYSKINNSGDSYYTLVTSHIDNSSEAKIINDISDLLNIKNVNGNEEFTQDGNKLVWNSNGSDIYYQGESQKNLPIECKITYTLDGKEISAKDLAGKSGKVKITIEYINKDKHSVYINGKKENLYTPFVVVCGTILDNATHKNISVTNAKVIDDGSKTTVVGISLPGMQESLGVSKNTIEVPSTIEITMDSTDFELNNIVTYVTPKIIESSDLDLFDNLDSIYSKVSTLQSSSKQLVEGAKTLKDGASTYSEKSKEFNTAMTQIASGTDTVNSNYSKINSGISSLSSGSSTLQAGAETLNTGIGELSTGLSSLPESVTAIYNGSTKLNEGINGSEGLVAGFNTFQTTITENTTASITDLTKSNGILNTELTNLTTEYSEITTQLSTLSTIKASGTLSATDLASLETVISELSTRKTEIEKRKASISAQITNNQKTIKALSPTTESKKEMQKLEDGIKDISTGSKDLNNYLKKLDSSVSTLPTSLAKLKAGSSNLLTGTKKVSSSVYTLSQGSSKLQSGIQSLNSNTQLLAKANSELTKGATTLSEGATTLSDGINKFDKEGIQTICNYINGDLKDVSLRIKELQKLSEKYNNFTMLNSEDSGSVKFIMIVDSIKKDDNKKEDMIIDNQTTDVKKDSDDNK